jgi:hypothetical protein
MSIKFKKPKMSSLFDFTETMISENSPSDSQTSPTQASDNNTKSQRKPIAKRSFVWSYFSELKNEQKALCIICNKKVDYISSTTPLSHHLAKHNICKETWHEKNDSNYVYSSESDFEEDAEPTRRMNDAQPDRAMNKVHQALLTFFIKTDQPMSLIENIHFKNLILQLNKNYQIPSRYILKQNILPVMVNKIII